MELPTIEAPAPHQVRLRRLHHWLTLEGSSGIGLLALGAGAPFFPVVELLSIAALIFLPFLMRELIKTGHRGWIVTLVAMVGIPCLLWFLPVTTPVASFTIHLFPLLMFYLYCWLLRPAVEEWIEG